jgi:hypothetical protein
VLAKSIYVTHLVGEHDCVAGFVVDWSAHWRGQEVRDGPKAIHLCLVGWRHNVAIESVHTFIVQHGCCSAQLLICAGCHFGKDSGEVGET